MPLFSRPAVAEPTLEDRLLSAQLLSSDARSHFLGAALDLEQTADELDILAQDAQNELDRNLNIRDAAIADSDAARKVAANLRALVGEYGDQLAISYDDILV